MSRKSETGESAREIVLELDAMARHHFNWITESFVHVLILQVWGEREIATRIDDEYEREVPRCFRIVERIYERGGCPSLEAGRKAYIHHLPAAGRTVAKMLERERAMIEGFNDALDRSAERLAGAGEDEGSAIAREARSSRSNYLDWLSRAENSISAENRERTLCSVTDASNPHWIALNRLYAHLQPAVEETCVHMLLLRRMGHSEASDQAWRDSYAYMLYAADIVRLFGRCNWALELASPEVSGDVREPAIADSAEGALESEQNRLADLAEAAISTAAALSGKAGPDLEAIPRAVLGYARARIKGKAAKPSRPARPIEKMLEAFAYKFSDGSG